MKEQEGDDYSDEGDDVEYVEDYADGDEQYYQQENNPPSYSKPKSKRWDQLYELNKLQKETREYMRKALEEEKDEDPECTFHPKISEMSQKLVQKNRPDFIERNNLWLNQRKEKIKHIGDSKEDKELLHCTFQPQLNTKLPPAPEGTEIRKHQGVNRFLERQEAARRERKRRQEILKGGNYASTRSKAKKKMTIPKNPKLSAYQTQQRGRKIKEPKVKSGLNDKNKREIEEMYRDPNAIYPKNVSLYEAVMTLHEHLNSFEISFE